MSNKVCMYLPPFAGDYSGVCSALFDLGGMICIHDAAGCTGNYTHFDEPRWYGSDSMVYCTSLRKVDAILGDDEKLIGKIVRNAQRLSPKFIAIVGSPVPNVIGFDFNGVAKAIESRTSIPTFGFETAGIKGTYLDGILMAYKSLASYYEKHPEKREMLTDDSDVAIPGISPLDMPQEVFDKLCDDLRQEGVKLMNRDKEYGSLKFYQYPEKVKLNLVWNLAGLKIAKMMNEKYKTPYIVNFPIGKAMRDRYFELIKKGETAVLKNEGKTSASRKAFIFADPVVGDSIGNVLRNGWDVSLFNIEGKDDASTFLKNEEEIMERLKDGYDLLIADPLFMQFAREDTKKVVLPH